MTIRFLKAWNGYDDQSIAALSSTEETRLVNLGIATYSLFGEKSSQSSVVNFESMSDRPPASKFGKGVATVEHGLHVSDGNNWIIFRNNAPLPAQPLKSKLLITNIDNVSWTFSGTGAIKRLSALHAVEQTNTIEIKHDGTTSGQTALALAPWVGDLSSYDYIEVAYYSEYYPSSSRTSVTIAFFTSSPGTADNAAATIFLNKPGWNIARIKKSLFTVSGAFSWADIKQIRFNATSSTVPRVFYISRMYAVKAKSNLATFTINYDDGFESAEYGVNLASARGLPAGLFVITDLVNATGYATTKTLQQLSNKDVPLMLHGAASGYDNWNDQIVAQGLSGFDAAIKQNIDVLENSLGGSAVLMSYPQGVFHKTNETLTATNYGDIITTLQNNGVKFGRTVKWSDSTDQICHANYDPLYPKNGMFMDGAFSLNNSLTLVQAKALIDAMIDWGGVFNIYGHKIAAAADSVSWTEQDTIDLFDYIAAKQYSGLCYVDTLEKVTQSMVRSGLLTADHD